MLTSITTVPYRFDYHHQIVEPQDTSRSITHSDSLDDQQQQSIDQINQAAQSRLHRHLARAGALNLTNAVLFATTLLGMGLFIKQPPMTWIAVGYAMGHSMSFMLATLSAKNQMHSIVAKKKARPTINSRGA